MEKGEWGQCWAHFIGALGLPDDVTRRRQGETWYVEFARPRHGDVVRRSMRRILDALEPGSAFPDFGFAREHFAAEDRAERILARLPVAPCDKCSSTGTIELRAYRANDGQVRWVTFDEWCDLNCTMRGRTAKCSVRCSCPRGQQFRAREFDSPPPDARKALERHEQVYGAA